MSKNFMNICAHERNRLNLKIATAEYVLTLYRDLYRLYGELALASETPEDGATYMAGRTFISETVAPILKREIESARESLENVTRAQEAGCIQISQGGKSA